MLAPTIVALLTALVGGWAFVRWAPRRALDIPNARSSHSQPTPRGGGVAIVAGFALGLGTWLLTGGSFSPRAEGWLVGAAVIAAVGFVDDVRPLPALPRLIVHVAAAALLAVVGVQQQDPVPIVVAFVYITLLTNVYNFMDGIDGLAASQAVIAGAALAIAGTRVANPLIASSGAVLAAASAGFLAWNRPKARCFMGDVASTFLGYSFAGLCLLGSIGVGGGRLPLEFGLVLLAPFLFDSLLTLSRRIIKGERWYAAHRSHYYQRLVQRGLSHGQVTGLYAGLAVAAAAAALAGIGAEATVRQFLVVLGYLPMLAVVGLVWRLEAIKANQQPNEAPIVVTQGHS